MGKAAGRTRRLARWAAWRRVAHQVSDDEWHEAAVATLSGLVASRHPLMTTNQVVGETYTLLRVTCGHAAAVAFLDRLEESRRVECIFVGKELEARVYRLLRQYADQDFSFVDATSFAVMRSERIRHAFALDQHFATAGFTRIPLDLSVAQM